MLMGVEWQDLRYRLLRRAIYAGWDLHSSLANPNLAFHFQTKKEKVMKQKCIRLSQVHFQMKTGQMLKVTKTAPDVEDDYKAATSKSNLPGVKRTLLTPVRYRILYQLL